MASKKLEYDGDIIREFAAKLYLRARSLATGYAIIGGLLGGMAGGMLGNDTALVLAMVVFTVVGALIGQNRAFAMKLEAQTALAQVQIEMNTRAKNDKADRG